MRTLLKVLIALLLLLAVTALILGNILYQKRIELCGHIYKLERSMIMVASMIEDEFPALKLEPAYPERDIDQTAAELIENPRQADFWSKYQHKLELDAKENMDLSKNISQLRRFYKLDPITYKPVKDPLTGMKITEGPGTMQEVLDNVEKKAKQQMNRLIDTRYQLTQTREELIDATLELNNGKGQLRTALVDIAERNTQIANLKDAVENRNNTIESRDEEIAGLSDEMTEQERTIALKDEEISELNIKIVQYKVLLGPNGRDELPKEYALSKGLKGKVASVNREWNFVVIDLAKGFAKQYELACDEAKRDLEPDFSVMRNESGQKKFVAKIKFKKVQHGEKLGIASIMNSWQISNIRKGDEIVF